MFTYTTHQICDLFTLLDCLSNASICLWTQTNFLQVWATNFLLEEISFSHIGPKFLEWFFDLGDMGCIWGRMYLGLELVHTSTLAGVDTWQMWFSWALVVYLFHSPYGFLSETQLLCWSLTTQYCWRTILGTSPSGGTFLSVLWGILNQKCLLEIQGQHLQVNIGGLFPLTQRQNLNLYDYVYIYFSRQDLKQFV